MAFCVQPHLAPEMILSWNKAAVSVRTAVSASVSLTVQPSVLMHLSYDYVAYFEQNK